MNYFLSGLFPLLFCASAVAQTEAPHPFASPLGSQALQGCTTTKSGSSFTPKCPINYITVDAANETINLPSIISSASTAAVYNIKLVITYTGAFTPTFASGTQWVGGGTPPACGGGTTSGCFSSATGLTDWVFCDTIDATHIGCAAPLTNVGATSWTLVQHATCAATSGCTTSPVSTVGANLIVLAASCSSTPTFSDSSSNNYTPAVAWSTNSNVGLYFVASPTTNASQTFSISSCAGAAYAVLDMEAWSATGPPPSLDQSAGNATTAATIQLTSPITPTVSPSLIVAAARVTTGAAGVPTVVSPFTVSDATAFNNGINYPAAMAYLVQGAIAGVNPQFVFAGAAPGGVVAASFKP